MNRDSIAKCRRPIVEAIEARRLFAASCVGPDLQVEQSVSYHYDLDETGYHWVASVGDMGEENTFVNGRRLRADFDTTIEGEGLYDNPDLDAFYDRYLARHQAEYDLREPDHPVTFRLIKYEDGSFEVAGVAPREPGPPVISDGGFMEGIIVDSALPEASSTELSQHVDPAPAPRPLEPSKFRSVADELIDEQRDVNPGDLVSEVTPASPAR